MAKAIAIIEYVDDEKKKIIESRAVDYFLDSKTLSEFNQLGLTNNERADIEIYAKGINLEVSIRNAKMVASLKDRNYKIIKVVPYEGYGQSVTIFYGVRQYPK